MNKDNVGYQTLYGKWIKHIHIYIHTHTQTHIYIHIMLNESYSTKERYRMTPSIQNSKTDGTIQYDLGDKLKGK